MKLKSLFFAAALILCSIASAAAPGYSIPSTSSGSPTSVSVASIPWTRWLKADAITPVADGTALSSWVDSAGSGDPAVQATGGNQPVYKVAANGINGVPVVRFSGGQFLRTTSGGNALTGAWYMGAVAKLNAIGAYQHFICFGNDSTGQRRGMLLFRDPPVNTLTFNGLGNDLYPVYNPLSVGGVYFFEIYSDGTYIHILLNGIEQAVAGLSLTAYSSAAITFGANNSSGENINADVAEFFILNAAPTPTQALAVRSYVASKYALSLGILQNAVISNGTTISNGNMIDDASKTYFENPVVIGGRTPILTGTSAPSSFTSPAALTVNGVLAAENRNVGEHMLISNSSGNVLSLWNKIGFSAVRFLDNSGQEGGAVGYSSGTPPWGTPTGGSTFLEASNLGNPTIGGSFRFIQTGNIAGGGAGSYLRYEYLTSGDLVFYNCAGGNTPGEIMRFIPNGGIQIPSISTPPKPPSGSSVEYLKGSKKVIRYNNGGTDAYFSLDLSQASTATWVNNGTTAP